MVGDRKLLIRVLPPVVWVVVFFSAAGSTSSPLPTRLPSGEELATLISTWGFRRKGWEANPLTVFTHLFVHASASHLAANIVSYAAVSLEFGDARHHDMRRTLLGDSVQEACAKTVGSSLVLIIGGMVGGLAGHFLHVKRQEERAKGAYGFGFTFLENIVGSVHQAASNRVYVCGASAGIAAIGGFNAVYYCRYLSGLFTLVPVLAVLFRDEAQGTLFGSEGNVGHAAHLGGFACGCVLGLLWKHVGGRRNGVVGGRRLGEAAHGVFGVDDLVAAQRARWRQEFNMAQD